MPRGKMEADAMMWRERVRRWKASGLTAKQFSAQEGIERHTALSWWCHRLKQDDAKVAQVAEQGPTLKLLRLQPVQSRQKHDSKPHPSSGVSVECGSCRVHIQRDFDEEALRRVLRCLESAQ